MASAGPAQVQTGSVSSIGGLLLRGWTMLAQSCDDCRVPLMQDPQSGEKLCVNCQKTTHDAQEGAASVRDELLTSSRRQKSEDGDEDLWDERLGPFADRERQSERPVSHNGGFQQHQHNTGSQSSAETNSEKLAVKMTQGWALTSIFCPRCTTPLVRNRDKSLFCVGCDLYTIPQSQAANFSSPPEGSLRSSQKRTKLASSPDETTSPRGNRLVTAGETSRGLNQRSERMELDYRPPGRAREPVEMGITEQSRVQQLVYHQKSTRETLLEKMEEVKGLLRSTPASNVDLCLKYVKLIESCWDLAEKLGGPNMESI